MTRTLSTKADPDFAQLTTLGWSIISCVGPYVTVWRDGEECVLLWKDGVWLRLENGRTSDFSPYSTVTEPWSD